MTCEEGRPAVAEHRAARGRSRRPLADSRAILLTTTDPGTGTKVAERVGFLYDSEERLLVVAVPSEGGTFPAWYHNLLAEPRVSVETGAFVMTATARVLAGDERDTVFARAAEVDPTLDDEQTRLGTPIPIVALYARSHAPAANGSWGDELKAVHDGFRRELAVIRAEIRSAGPRLAAQLRINCLTACGMLHHHHTSEDAEMFPRIEERHPESAAAMARLREEHATVAQLLGGLQATVSDEAADSASVLAEVERVTSELEAHLDHEERQLVPLLNALQRTEPAGDRA